MDPEGFSRLEQEGWKRAAGSYEHWWSSLTRSFVEDLVEAAGVRRGMDVLDLACGPGYVSEAAAARGANTIGTDFSSEMIDIARRRLPSLRFEVGDAQQIDFPDASFDAVLNNFGILHLPDPERSLAESRRVLRRGGRLGFTVWADPKGGPGARIVADAIEAHADLTIAIPKGPDPLRFAEVDACRDALAEAGFDPRSVRFTAHTVSWWIPSETFLFEAERDGGVRTAAILGAQPPERLERIREAIERGVAAYPAKDGFAIPMVAHVVVATSTS